MEAIIFFSNFYFQVQRKPYSSAFRSLGNSCSSLRLKCVSDNIIKLLGAALVLSSPIFQGYFLPTPTGWESQSWNHSRTNHYHVPGVKGMFWPVPLILMPWTFMCFNSWTAKLKILSTASFLPAMFMVIEILLKMMSICDEPELWSDVRCQAVIFLISHHQAT